jgi:hypothetical protein
MVFQPGAVTPVIIKVIPQATPEVTVVDVIVDSLGLTGLILVGSLVVGGLLGMLFIWASRRRQERRQGDDRNAAIQLHLSAPPD